MLRAGVQWAVSPLQNLGSSLAKPIDTLRTNLVNASADEETLTELRDRNAYLLSQLGELQQYKEENESLRAMLGLASSFGASGVAAQVITGPQDTWTQTIVINRGSNDGVGLDMPVTDGASLVGQVCAVSPTTATVRLINGPMFSMSVSVGESGAAGILSGSVDSTVRVDYVSSDDAVSVGDVVRASGRSDVYPKGLAVGTVVSVVSEPSSLFQDIVVKPLTQAANASEVFVITAYGAQVDAVSTDQDLESGQSAGDAQ
ncbi:MAG: rod shape-determining protein MreC [Coriobacteriaceae bacterium]|nr:rod shape-determining protein MreC [Coriobacteriaceae bacterium]